MPKSSGVPTSPCPNRCCQTRFTATRLVSGFWSLVSQSASCARPLTSARSPAAAARRSRRTRGEPFRRGGEHHRECRSPSGRDARDHSQTSPAADAEQVSLSSPRFPASSDASRRSTVSGSEMESAFSSGLTFPAFSWVGGFPPLLHGRLLRLEPFCSFIRPSSVFSWARKAS